MLKWVIYRELRDFVNLHTHYRVAGLAKSVEMPSFPKTSLPYFNLLRKERGSSKELSKSEFARSQRMALETYLLKLIRAFMFRPEANRLAKFLEISAASISFAARGGVTGKQGFLRISSPNNISRKAQGSIMLSSLVPRQATPKWFIVRESYIVAVADPGSAEVWDVFLFDQDFQLERPKRLYRQGLSNIRSVISPEDAERDQNEDDMIDAFEGGEKTEKGVMPMSKAKRFLMGRKKHADRPSMGDPQDPSTTDIANQPEEMQSTSQHTFYLNNAEIRLKLTAKSERQMDQFIASIERIAQKSPWAGRNRFDSFAPIRQNVSAKWLADGVSDFMCSPILR